MFALQLSTILEILEIEGPNILYNPGNVGHHIFPNFSYPGNLAGGRFLCSGFPGLDYFWKIVRGMSGYPGNIEI